MNECNTIVTSGIIDRLTVDITVNNCRNPHDYHPKPAIRLVLVLNSALLMSVAY